MVATSEKGGVDQCQIRLGDGEDEVRGRWVYPPLFQFGPCAGDAGWGTASEDVGEKGQGDGEGGDGVPTAQEGESEGVRSVCIRDGGFV
mmetsp:Transcript_8685/g.16392  ORF Transcript_8685/g.16392 Transcript_8685/m.16392 type:complete len:89 (+) Transcript_8685:699-965(+)